MSKESYCLYCLVYNEDADIPEDCAPVCFDCGNYMLTGEKARDAFCKHDDIIKDKINDEVIR